MTTDYSKPAGYDPSDWQQVQQRQELATRPNRYSAGGSLVLPERREPVRACRLQVLPDRLPGAQASAALPRPRRR